MLREPKSLPSNSTSFNKIVNLLNEILDYMRSLRILPSPHMNVTRTSNGTIIEIKPSKAAGGNPVTSNPTTIVDARWS